MVSFVSLAGEDNVKWIKLKAIGEQDKPLPTIWIATKHLRITEFGLNEVVVLTETQYQYVRNIAISFANKMRPEKFPKYGTLEVSEFAGRTETIICNLPPLDACSLLTQLISNPDINGTAIGRSVVNLGTRIGCGEAAFHVSGAKPRAVWVSKAGLSPMSPSPLAGEGRPKGAGEGAWAMSCPQSTLK